MHKSLIGHIQNNIWKNSSLADLPVAALKDGPAHWEQRKSRRPRYDQSHSQIHVNVPRSHEVIICCDIGMGGATEPMSAKFSSVQVAHAQSDKTDQEHFGRSWQIKITL